VRHFWQLVLSTPGCAGDNIKSGDVLCEIETDKATIDFQFQDDAILAKILVDTNASDVDVKVGDVLALVVEDEADLSAVRSADYKKAASPAAASGPSAPASNAAAPVVASSAAAHPKSSAPPMPSARVLMQNRGVDAGTIHGTSSNAHRTTMFCRHFANLRHQNRAKYDSA
jgi:pyruvate dehydrogenase E2 component (dihydrolipoamide acetyltransferase)